MSGKQKAKTLVDASLAVPLLVKQLQTQSDDISKEMLGLLHNLSSLQETINTILPSALLERSSKKYKNDKTVFNLTTQVNDLNERTKRLQDIASQQLEQESHDVNSLAQLGVEYEKLKQEILSIKKVVERCLADIKKHKAQFEEAKQCYESKMTAIYSRCDLNQFDSKLFHDISVRAHQEKILALSKELNELEKTNKKRLVKHTKIFIKGEHATQIYLQEGVNLYQSLSRELSQIEETLKEPITAINNARYMVISNEIIVQDHITRLKERVTLPTAHQQPYSQSSILSNYVESMELFLANIEDIEKKHHEHLNQLEIDDHWISNANKKRAMTLKLLENIEPPINKHYNDALTEIRRIDSIILDNTKEINDKYHQAKEEITSTLDALDELINTLKSSGIFIKESGDYQKRYDSIRSDYQNFLIYQASIAELSKSQLYNQHKTFLTNIATYQSGLLLDIKKLAHEAKKFMVKKKQEFNQQVDNTTQILAELANFNETDKGIPSYLEDGTYQHNNRQYVITSENKTIRLSISDAMIEEVNNHRFYELNPSGFSPPLAAKKVMVTQVLEKHNIKNGELLCFLLKESKKKRACSAEHALATQLIETINDLNTSIQDNNYEDSITNIVAAQNTLQSIKRKISALTVEYLNLHIKDKKIFLKKILNIIQHEIVNGPIECLSDSDRSGLTQAIRIWIIAPIMSFCRHHFGWFKSRPTFFAGSEEKRLFKCGMEARIQIEAEIHPLSTRVC